MAPTHILVVDRDPKSCPENHAERLTKLLQNLLPASTIDVNTLHHWSHESTTSQPELIFLRPSSTEELSQEVYTLRKKWNATPILGLFCDEKDTLATTWYSLLDNLDDFLSCPIRAIDLYPRVWRLMQGKIEC